MEGDIEQLRQGVLEILSKQAGRLFALQRAVRILIERDKDPAACRASIETSLDGFMAMAAMSELNEPRKAGIREVQAYLARDHKGDPA